jgi:hypothetical protein
MALSFQGYVWILTWVTRWYGSLAGMGHSLVWVTRWYRSLADNVRYSCLVADFGTLGLDHRCMARRCDATCSHQRLRSRAEPFRERCTYALCWIDIVRKWRSRADRNRPWRRQIDKEAGCQ